MGIDFKRQVDMRGLMAQRETIRHKDRQSASTLNGPQTLDNVDDYERDAAETRHDNIPSSERSLSDVLKSISSASRTGYANPRSRDDDLGF